MEKKRKKFGEYEIRMHPSGAFSLYGPGIRSRGYYIESDRVLKAKCQKLLDEGAEGFPSSLKNKLSYRGILQCGKRSITAGKQALGIKGPFVKTKRGNVESGVIVSKAEIVKAIKDFWPSEQVYENAELKSLTDFIKVHRREYYSAQRRRVHGKSFMDVLEQVYPGIYERVAARLGASAINPKKVSQILVSRFNSGLPIASSALRYSTEPDERRLFNQIYTITVQQKRILKKQDTSYDKIVSRLTGLDEEDIRFNKGSVNFLAMLAEELVHFFFSWASVLETPLGQHTPKGTIYRQGQDRHFEYNEKDCRADLRIGNKAIEVKSGIGAMQDKELEDMLGKYTPRRNKWKTGEPIAQSTVVFIARPGFYSGSLDRIKNTGIQVIEYEWFKKHFTQVVKELEITYPNILQDTRPRLANIDYLLSLSDEIALNPSMILRPSNTERRKWSQSVLESLAKEADSMENGGNINYGA